MTTRIAFTADLHIDSYGSRIDPRTGLNHRLVDFLRTTRFVAQTARDEGAEALVVAGDITERRHVNDWLLRHIHDALSDGPERQILLRGNHDAEINGESKVSVLAQMERGWSASSWPAHQVVGDVVLALMPYMDRHALRARVECAGCGHDHDAHLHLPPGLDDDGVTAWLKAHPECHTPVGDGTCPCPRHVSWSAAPDADVFRALRESYTTIARGLYAQAKRAHADKACVLVMHQTLDSGWMSDTQQALFGEHGLVIDTQALASIGFEGIVAGHLHRHQVIPAAVPVMYCGSIERVDHAEGQQTKGFVIADIEPGRFEWRFVETPARRYVTVSGSDLRLFSGHDHDFRDAVVRVLDLEPDQDAAQVRGWLEGEAGAFEVTSIERRRAEAPEVAGGIAETLSPHQAVDAWFAEDEDREALVERARGVLAEVAG